MQRNEAIKYILLRSLGNFLVLFSLYGVFATFGPALYQEVKFRTIQAKGVTFTVAAAPKVAQASSSAVRDTQQASFVDILAGKKEQVIVPKDTQFSILIPKIGASAKIYPNVDPGNANEFLPVLQKGIAHAKGSVFPGMNGNVYLFAHSTDNWWHVGQYNAVFYLLNNLSDGDEIIIFFEGVRYDYVVSNKVITDPTDVSFIANDHLSSEQLVLQTCWPPGTTWKRLYIIAKPKKS